MSRCATKGIIATGRPPAPVAPFMLQHVMRLMGDWTEEKAKEMSRGGVFGYCGNCDEPLVRFDGDKCTKCGTVKK